MNSVKLGDFDAAKAVVPTEVTKLGKKIGTWYPGDGDPAAEALASLRREGYVIIEPYAGQTNRGRMPVSAEQARQRRISELCHRMERVAASPKVPGFRKEKKP